MFKPSFSWRYALSVFIASACLLLSACDQQKIVELPPGEATEADVKAKWGEPEAVWDGINGERILEYNRQPAGQRNYHAIIGPDGKLVRFSQVLQQKNFDLIQPGVAMEDVRKILGKPAREIPYKLQNEVHWNYRYLANNNNDEMLFTVVFEPTTMRVKNASGGPDPDARGGVHRNSN